MGFMICLGHCYFCKRPISFSPSKVPSMPAKLTTTGQKEPVCRTCIEQANRGRARMGMPLFEILEGAYGADPEGPEGER